MPLKVIGAGLPRTGTMSLKFALEQLGLGPCYHFEDLYKRPNHIPLWDKVYSGESVDWEEIFSDYAATTDLPACIMYKALAAYYPDAKVILTRRRAEDWNESVTTTVASDQFREARQSAWDKVPGLEGLIKKLWGRRQANHPNRSPTPEEAAASFERHCAEVCATISPERLLVYEVNEGWEPLCRFLDLAVPATPFPHSNERNAFMRGALNQA